MSPYRVIAMSEAVAAAVRDTRLSPFAKHPTHEETATGYGPCRLCLRTFHVGEEHRILLTFDPFTGLERLPLPGPVFIHAEACRRHAEDAGFPEDMRSHALTFNAYGRGRHVVAQRYVEDGRVDGVIEELLGRSNVDYIHVRDTKAGCYDFRIEREI